MIINLNYLNGGGGGTGSGVTPSEVNALINSAITQGEYINNAEYISSAKTIVLYQDSTEVATIDATAFIKDGMVDSVTVSGSILTIVFNTDSGKEPINVDLSDVVDLSNYWTSAQTQSAINSAVSGKQDTLTAGTGIDITSNVISVTGGSGGGVSSAEVETMISEAVSGKQDTLVYYQEDTEGDGAATIDIQSDDGEGNTSEYWFNVGGGTNDMGAFTQYDDGEGNVTNNNTQINVEAAGLTISSDSNDGEDSTMVYVTPTNIALDSTSVTINGDEVATLPNVVQTSAITTAVTSASTDAQIPTAKAVFDAIPTGGTSSNVVEVTQAEYNALVSGGTVDPDTLYIISDASEINLSGYALSSAVTQEITAAVSGKADTSAVTAISDSLTGYVQTTAITTAVTSASTDSQIPSAKAVYDAIPTGGTGASYNAGTNISIDTANTINCTLPITAITTNDRGWIKIGSGLNLAGNDNDGYYMIAIGKNISNNNQISKGQVAICPADTTSNVYSVLSGNYPIGIGHRINSVGDGAIAIGDKANASGSNFVAIGKETTATGTTKMNLNNQITVDTSNQVYISNSANTSTYCVQEKIETTEAALGGLKLVSLTQSEYDQLATKDSATIYFIKDNSN